MKVTNAVVPAEAGTHALWIPAFAGMTRLSTEFSWAFGPPKRVKISVVAPAQAGAHAGWIPAYAGMTRLSTEREERAGPRRRLIRQTVNRAARFNATVIPVLL